MSDYACVLHVDETDGGYTAYLDDGASPLRGFGTSPLEAVRALCETLKEWPISGAERWLATPAGVELGKKFVPGYKAKKPGGSA